MQQPIARNPRADSGTPARRPGLIGLGALTLLSLGVAGYVLHTYLPGLAGTPDDDAPPLPNATLLSGWLILHALSGTVALLAGTTQWLLLRRTSPARWHRRIGILYVVAVGIAGLSGLWLAPTAAGGLVGRWGFGILAVLWLGSTTLGVIRLRQGDIAGHRRAMIRSFALTCAAISLRLQLPLALAIGFEFDQAYPWIAWSCWLPNLIFAEIWLRRA